MKTEDRYYDEHLVSLIDIIYNKISILENKDTMDDQDEIEFDALDRLVRDLEGL